MEVNSYFLTIRFNLVEKSCPFSFLVVEFCCAPCSLECSFHEILSYYSRLYDVDSYVVSSSDSSSNILLLSSFDF